MRFTWMTAPGEQGALARVLELDLSNLTEGAQTITIEVAVEGLGAVTAVREFVYNHRREASDE
jgi:hypothetical protein